MRTLLLLLFLFPAFAFGQPGGAAPVNIKKSDFIPAGKMRVHLDFQADTSDKPLNVHALIENTDGLLLLKGTGSSWDTLLDDSATFEVSCWTENGALGNEFFYNSSNKSILNDTVTVTTNGSERGFDLHSVKPGNIVTPGLHYVADYLKAHPTVKAQVFAYCDASGWLPRREIKKASKSYMKEIRTGLLSLGVDLKQVQFDYQRQHESLGCGFALQGLSEEELRRKEYAMSFAVLSY